MADYNTHRFLSLFNQNMFDEFARNKDIISEKGFELEEGEYPEIQHQISLRGWKRLTSPRTKVKVLMIKEFFANAARTNEEHHPFTSFVRGVEVDFSPANIKRVIKFKDNTPGVEVGYNTRLYANQMLEELCKDAGVPFEEYKGTQNIDKESSITAKVMEIVRGGAVPIMRRHQEEEDEHNEGQGHEGEADQDQEQDQVMLDAEDIYEPHQHQSYMEHETGAESWVNHEVQYEQQQQNYYEPHHSPQPQPQHQPQPQQQFVFDFQIKTYQEYQYDQMKAIIAQQQEVIATQNQEFQAMRSKQDQLEKGA
ncbi:hypothetical protein PIB30_102091 [Stylosanthes scabra]|uniref:Putative plant transposon protein domain-containing protein n=1 Tax=Stylosanthes scabra TaxID=79078 RepID=A0ABU6YWJ9_9FABA|nr:hypothetical protein [Stylosanthes scabra]